MTIVKKYRPRSFDEIIGQDNTELIKKIALQEKMPHLMFIGPVGTGKTSTAECIARERYGKFFQEKYVELNASDERGIKTVREKIKRISMLKGERIIFLSESDQMTPDAQGALRRIMEKTQAVFILDANYGNNLINAIKSRCAFFYFKPIDASVLGNYLEHICKQEKIIPNIKVLTQIVRERSGDLRGALNQLDAHIDYKEKKIIDTFLPEVFIDTEMKKYINAIKKSNFIEAMKYIDIIYINNKYNVNMILDKLLDRITVFPKEIQLRLYQKLEDTANSCKNLYNPLIAFKSFTSFAIISQYIESEVVFK